MNQRQQNSTSYPITFFMADSADHITGKTGLTPTVTISKNGGSFASPQGSVQEIGNGWYRLNGNATDRNTLGELLIHAEATGADPFDGRYVIVPWDPFDGAGMGLSRLDAAISTRATQTQIVSDGVPFLGARIDATISSRAAPGAQMTLQDGAITSAKIADGAITAAKAPNLDVAVSSRAPASTALSNAVWTDAKAGYVDVAISSRSTLTAADVWNYGTRTLSSFGTLVSDIFSYAVEGSMTFVQAVRLKLAVLVGKSSGGGTNTLKFRDMADSKDRITATVDTNGNRTAITRDGT